MDTLKNFSLFKDRQLMYTESDFLLPIPLFKWGYSWRTTVVPYVMDLCPAWTPLFPHHDKVHNLCTSHLTVKSKLYGDIILPQTSRGATICWHIHSYIMNNSWHIFHKPWIIKMYFFTIYEYSWSKFYLPGHNTTPLIQQLRVW